MKTIKSCEFNTTGCAELRFRDGSMIFIDCIAAENEVADNRLRRSEPACLIRNFETENAAARRAFRQTRRADTDCACPHVHTYSGACGGIDFSIGVAVRCARFRAYPTLLFADRLRMTAARESLCKAGFRGGAVQQDSCGTE